MNKKFKKNGGFTLVEMLIVVAIIAILIAISIPLVSASLERARHSVDDANKRDAQSMATVYYLSMTPTEVAAIPDDGLELFYYVNANKQGQVFEKAEDATKAGYTEAIKSTCTGSGSDCDEYDQDATELSVTISKTGDIVGTSWDGEGGGD